MSLYLCTTKILSLSPDILYALFLFAATVFTYNIPRFVNSKLAGKPFGLSILFIIPVAILVVLVLYRAQSNFNWIFSLPFVAVLFYYWPFSQRNLRTLPYLKIFTISLCWALATVTCPLFLAREIDTFPMVTFLTIERFLFIFAITIPFDIRDMEIDRTNNLTTIPLAIGTRSALWLSTGILVCYMSFTAYYYGPGPLLYSRIICSLFVLFLFINLKPERSSYYYTGWIDGSMILQGVLLYAFS